MDNKQVSIAKAKDSFSSWVRDVEHGGTVVITRRGKAVAALVGANELAQLKRLRAAGPEAGLASVAGGWKGSEDLTKTLAKQKRSSRRR
jgi:prevent-host-death family protein